MDDLPVPGDPTSRGWSAEYENVSLSIERSRWQACFIIRRGNSEIELVASADAFYTENDGLWLGTIQQTRDRE